jgi:hypothetical protein
MKNAGDSSVLATPEYRRFIEDLKARVISARISAARAVNRDGILLYWDIGRGIVEKQRVLGWGDSVVEMVSADLRRAFPGMRGFSPDSVWRMRQFYSDYANPAFLEQAVPEMKKHRGEFLAQAVPEKASQTEHARHDLFLSRFVRDLLLPVPWGHHLEILKKAVAPAARLWYLRAVASYGWTRNVLLNQIKGGAYERAVTEKKTHNFPLALPEHLAEQADEMLKSSYNLFEPAQRQRARAR